MTCFTALHGITYTKIVLRIVPLGLYHSLFLYWWTVSLFPGFAVINSKANSFLNAFGCVCLRAQMQVFLWGQIPKNRMAGLTSSTLHFFTDITKLPSKKGCVIPLPGLDIIEWFNSSIISLITSEVNLFFEYVLFFCGLPVLVYSLPALLLNYFPPFDMWELSIDTLGQKSTDFFCKRPGRKYLALWPIWSLKWQLCNLSL